MFHEKHFHCPMDILFTVKEPVRLKSLIDVLFCKLHYGFGGNRLSTLSKQVSFSEFIIDRYDVSVYKRYRMYMIH